MSEANEAAPSDPNINVESADNVNVVQQPTEGVPADAPTQETPETPPEPSFQAHPDK